MKRSYPKREESIFLVCEQARAELNNKVSVIGWYGADEIVFHPERGEKPPYGLASLSFLIRLKGGSGVFATSFSVEGPDGESIMALTDLPPHTIASGKTTLIGVQIAGPIFKTLGEHTARLKLERKIYEFNFTVSASRKPVNKKP